MAKISKRAISIVLCLMLVLTTAFACTVSVFAASGDTVYVRANNGWSTLYCYMWNSDSDKNKDWPGVAMTKVEDGVYSYTLTKAYSNIIFNNGSGGNGNQTNDMTYPGNGQIYDLSEGSWSTYEGAATQTTTATTATKATTATTATTATKATSATTATTPSSTGTTVYFKNTANWGSVNCYMWNSDSDNNKSWPGAAMTKLGDNIWMYSASKTFKNCIFNNGSEQTSDLNNIKSGYMYDYSAGTWEVYDTSPLQVTAYTADPASEIYTGTDVTLSTTATSSASSTVYYKISVKNSSGTSSVLKDFSTASSAVWSPTTAGTYTITFEYKDGAGNENSRTLSLTVASDSALVKPVIKSVTPYNRQLVALNKATTVNVKAGGGITGTNLLFYKYIVTDPNGVKNTPYYTLNSTYSFTPNKAGNYVVDVYVQGSNNSTVNKTYTYTASSSAQEQTDPVTMPTTQPIVTTPVTTTAPVTQPTTTEPVVTLKGDIDEDNMITVKDATLVQKFAAEMSDVPYISVALGDMNNDGSVDVKDATEIQKKAAE